MNKIEGFNWLKVKKQLKKYKRSFLIILLAFFLFGILIFYSLFSNAKKTIITYNYFLSQAYGSFDPNYLRPIASEKEVRRLSIVIRNYQFKKKQPMMEVENIDFESFDWSWSGVKVKTRENWNFYLRDITSGKLDSKSIYTYKVLYILRRVGLSFIVDEVKVLEEKKKLL